MDRFFVPDWDAPIGERRTALDAMNAIKLTIDQFEEGWELYRKTQVRIFTEKLPHEAPMAALEDFCAGENLLPTDVAAAAILQRSKPIMLAFGGCVDLRTEHPDTYAALILEPIFDDDLVMEYDDEAGE